MKPLVGVVMGSDSDLPVLEKTFEVLRKLRIPFEARVLSAHRTPGEAAEWASSARERGLRVIIAAAGGAAHLAGAMAAHTTLPVIGVPLAATPLSGMDALLSTAQMPPGVPVATVAVGDFGAVNAAYLAARILGVADEGVQERLDEHRADMATRVLAKDRALNERVAGG